MAATYSFASASLSSDSLLRMTQYAHIEYSVVDIVDIDVVDKCLSLVGSSRM